jgi:hypothetical protein
MQVALEKKITIIPHPWLTADDSNEKESSPSTETLKTPVQAP